MRTYQYRCAQCKKEFEVQREPDDESAQKCIHCGYKETKRIIGTAYVIYKGDGFTLKREKK